MPGSPGSGRSVAGMGWAGPAGIAWVSPVILRKGPREHKGYGRKAPGISMVDYNLINSLGNLDADVDAAVATALGDAADDISKLVSGDEVQDFTPGAIIKGRVSSIAGDDFVVELGLKSEGILDK